MKVLENQLTSAKEQNLVLTKNQQARKSDLKEKKKGSMGCCGGDSCIIM